MINIEELMINDWICLDGDTEYSSPMQVQQIRCGEIVADLDVYTDEDIHPIPLSDDVFKYNDFQYEYNSRYYHTWWLGTDEGYIGICVDDQFYVEGTNVYIRYVHELQHLMRIFIPGKKIMLPCKNT